MKLTSADRAIEFPVWEKYKQICKQTHFYSFISIEQQFLNHLKKLRQFFFNNSLFILENKHFTDLF